MSAPFPHLLAPLDLGFTTLRQPRADGQHAHRTRGRPQALSGDGRVLRRTRARRRRPDGDRRLRAQHRGLDQALRRHAGDRGGRSPASRRHRRGARRRRQDRAADPAHRPLRVPPVLRGAVAHQEPDHAVHAARVVGARHRAADPRLRALREAGARGRLRRRRGDGQRGLLHQPVPRHAHQPAHGRVGRRLREPHATAGGDRGARARGGRARLHPHLPPVDARPDPGRQQLARGGHAGARRSPAPAPRSSTPASAGTRHGFRRSPRACRAAPSPG